MGTVDPIIERFLTRSADDMRIGDCELLEEVGRGGFAPVWLARQTFNGHELRKAAVKLFSADVNAPDWRRIVDEAKALCRVNHPNVVKLYMPVEDKSVGVIGLVMEYIEGCSLEKRLASEKTLTVEQTLAVGIAIASALDAVHMEGLVHRDVKPSNIIESNRGIYKLIDFGITTTASRTPPGSDEGPDAISAPESTSKATTTRASRSRVGTRGYIDPACVRGAEPSPASDLYALGATLYRCLSGILPAATNDGSFDRRILQGEQRPLPLVVRQKGVPVELASLVDRLVSPNPMERGCNARDVADELKAIRSRGADDQRSQTLRATHSRAFYGRQVMQAALILGFLGALASTIGWYPSEQSNEQQPKALKGLQVLPGIASTKLPAPSQTIAEKPPAEPAVARQVPATQTVVKSKPPPPAATSVPVKSITPPVVPRQAPTNSTPKEDDREQPPVLPTTVQPPANSLTSFGNVLAKGMKSKQSTNH